MLSVRGWCTQPDDIVHRSTEAHDIFIAYSLNTTESYRGSFESFRFRCIYVFQEYFTLAGPPDVTCCTDTVGFLVCADYDHRMKGGLCCSSHFTYFSEAWWTFLFFFPPNCLIYIAKLYTWCTWEKLKSNNDLVSGVYLHTVTWLALIFYDTITIPCHMFSSRSCLYNGCISITEKRWE